MEGINWKKKLTSRKFWIAIAGFVSGLMFAFGSDAETVETVTGCIMSGASVVAYIIGEGLTDAAGASGVELEPLDNIEVAEPVDK